MQKSLSFSGLCCLLVIQQTGLSWGDRSLTDHYIGFQLPTAAYDNRNTDAVISNFSSYVSYGVSAVVTAIPAVDTDGASSFSADGQNLDPEIAGRVLKIIDAAHYRCIPIVLNLFEDKPGLVLKDREAFCNAARLAVKKFAEVESEGNINRWKIFFLVDHSNPEVALASAQAAHEVNPNLLVAGMVRDKAALSRFLTSQHIDILAIQDENLLQTLLQSQNSDTKPVFDLRTLGHGGWLQTPDGKVLQGVRRSKEDEISKEIERNFDAVATALGKDNYSYFAAFPSWFSGSERGKGYQDRFEIGGIGTPADPGIAWFLNRLDRMLRPSKEIEAVDHDFSIKADWLAAAEREEGFVPLFDGATLNGWTYFPEDHPWVVNDGSIVGPKKSGSWLRSWKRYGDYVLRFDVKLTPGCNSGVFLRAPLVARHSRNGMELQLLGVSETPTLHSAGALYSAEAARIDAFNPPGEWNEVEVYLCGYKIRVTINGHCIHDLDMGGHPILGNRLLRGFIGLQAHGAGSAYFRNLRIKELR